MPNHKLSEILSVIHARTGGTFDIDRLVGPRCAPDRAMIMAAAAGKRVPVAKSGINALRTALYAIANVEGACLAAQRQAFIDTCKKAFSEIGNAR